MYELQPIFSVAVDFVVIYVALFPTYLVNSLLNFVVPPASRNVVSSEQYTYITKLMEQTKHCESISDDWKSLSCSYTERSVRKWDKELFLKQ